MTRFFFPLLSCLALGAALAGCAVDADDDPDNTVVTPADRNDDGVDRRGDGTIDDNDNNRRRRGSGGGGEGGGNSGPG